MTRPICPRCGYEVSFPTLVNGQSYHYLCAKGEPQRREPVWLSRAKERPNGLARVMSGEAAL